MDFKITLLILHVSIIQSRKSPSASYCKSDKPCRRICGKFTKKHSPNFSNDPALQSLASSPHCMVGRCFCPEDSTFRKRCRSPNSIDTAFCTIPTYDAVPGAPGLGSPTIAGTRLLSVCTAKGLYNCCKKRRSKDRNYCVYPMRSNGNGIFAWPSLPAVPIPGGIQEIPNPTIPSPIKNEIEKDDEEEDKDGSIELEGND